MPENEKQLNKGTFLYVGNFELPDKGASANRVMSNRLLFAELGYRTAFLGITRGESFAGVRQSSCDADIWERSYPKSTRQWLQHSYSVQDLITAAAKYPDLKAVILYNCPYGLTRNAYKYFSKKGVKVLYDCTEWNPDTEGNPLKKLYKKYDAKCIQYKLEKYVDGLIPVSTTMYKQYTKKPKLLLPPLVDTEAPLWQQSGCREDGVYEFCYAGEPGKKDDLCKLIEAYQNVAAENVRLKIIGLSQAEFTADHPEYAEKLSGVIFTGRLSHEEVIQSLLLTDCFIFIRESNPRTNAGFPTKFVEAYTSGAQVITANISDIRSYEEDGITVLDHPALSDISSAMAAALQQNRTGQIRTRFDFRGFWSEAEAFIKEIKLV